MLSEPNYHTTKFFTENMLAVEMKKMQIFINRPLYLVLSILELNEILIYASWYDYVKRKCDEKAKLCYMDINSCVVYIKADDIYKDISGDIETRFGSSNYELDIQLPKRKKENSNWIHERWIKEKNQDKIC